MLLNEACKGNKRKKLEGEKERKAKLKEAIRDRRKQVVNKTKREKTLWKREINNTREKKKKRNEGNKEIEISK